MDGGNAAAELERVRKRLASLYAERGRLQRDLAVLEARLASELAAAGNPRVIESASVTNNSSSREKIELFRRLFVGRPDVFPVRWESARTGRIRIFTRLFQ